MKHEMLTKYSIYLAGLGFMIFGIFFLITPHASAQICNGISGSCAEPDFDPELIRGAVGSLFMLIEGAFGALIMVVAGIGAIIAAAMGAYRASVGMLVVALGSFRAARPLFSG